jgi:hypothetical protein
VLGQANLPADDADSDLLSDAFEDQLLAKYRPFYRFSKDGGEEDQRPADARWYVQQSALLSAGDKGDTSAVLYPLGVLQVLPDALLTKPPGAPLDPSHTNCVDTYLSPNGSDDGKPLSERGATWQEIETTRNIGLYGHVSRLANNPLAVQVQYWQFYPYNDAHHDLIADHEGDWELVEVTVIISTDQPAKDTTLSVTHYVHGQPVTTFFGEGTFEDSEIGLIKVLGTQPKNVQLDSPLGPLAAFGGHLELFCEGNDRTKCTHPVVYIEHGTHASWPTKDWEWTAAPKHGGDSVRRFLTSTPPNLGEVWAPRASTAGANLITQFTGHWGAFSRSLPPFVDTSNPRGPAMHRAWSWSFVPGPNSGCLE